MRLFKPGFSQGIANVTSTGVTCNGTATEQPAGIPTDFVLAPNYPNPFNPTTLIRYALPVPASVRLAVYDALGRLVDVLVEADQQPGRYEVTFEAGALSIGVYYYRLETGAFQDVRVMLLVR